MPQNTSTPVARSSRLLSRATAALARRPKTVRFRYTVKQLCVVNDHGLIDYTDTKAKCRHLKKLTCKGSSLGRYVFGSEISYNKAPPRLPGLGC